GWRGICLPSPRTAAPHPQVRSGPVVLASERGDAAQQGVAVVRTGTRSIERCHRIVPPRIALLVVVLIAGCATGQRPVSSEVTRPVSESKAIAEGSTHPPA